MMDDTRADPSGAVIIRCSIARSRPTCRPVSPPALTTTIEPPCPTNLLRPAADCSAGWPRQNLAGHASARACRSTNHLSPEHEWQVRRTDYLIGGRSCLPASVSLHYVRKSSRFVQASGVRGGIGVERFDLSRDSRRRVSSFGREEWPHDHFTAYASCTR